MAKSKNGETFWGELFAVGLYKRNQGRLTRQLTAIGAALIVFFGAYTMSQGLLGGFVNSYYRVNVTYSAEGADESVEGSVTSLAQQYGGSLATAENDLGERTLEYRFPTSRFGRINDELQKKMRGQASSFVDAAVASGVEVDVSKGSHIVKDSAAIQLGIPFLLAAAGAWVIYRLVNYPRFADFLISVEAEMDKVSWSSRQELVRATAVVIVTMVVLGAVLLLFDMIWQRFFELIGFLQITG